MQGIDLPQKEKLVPEHDNMNNDQEEVLGVRRGGGSLMVGDEGNELAPVLFASRRRHTRYWRDWSSDVCSSDLHQVAEYGVAAHWRYKEGLRSDQKFDAKVAWLRQLMDWQKDVAGGAQEFVDSLKTDRSEDRRGGKVCRFRWSPDHYKKKTTGIA